MNWMVKQMFKNSETELNIINEQCWFIHGFRFGTKIIGYLKYHSEGTPVWVRFDWSKAVGKVLGFYHSHPSGYTGPSDQDNRTMAAWVVSEGKPLICGIFCDGEQKAFLYYRMTGTTAFSHREVTVKFFGNFIFSDIGE